MGCNHRWCLGLAIYGFSRSKRLKLRKENIHRSTCSLRFVSSICLFKKAASLLSCFLFYHVTTKFRPRTEFLTCCPSLKIFPNSYERDIKIHADRKACSMIRVAGFDALKSRTCVNSLRFNGNYYDALGDLLDAQEFLKSFEEFWESPLYSSIISEYWSPKRRP